MRDDNHVTKLAFKLPGLGKQTAKHLARLNIFSIEDVLLHLPIRYQDRTRVWPIREIQVGAEVVVEGEIKFAETLTRGRTKLLCELKDATGQLFLRFFHVFPAQMQLLRPGTRVRCFGEIKWGQKSLEMFHPEIQLLDLSRPSLHDKLTPVYPATEGLTQNRLRKLNQAALALLEQSTFLPELLPETLLTKFNLLPLKTAFKTLHWPTPTTSCELAQKRLAFEELLAHRMRLLQLKRNFKAQNAYPLPQIDASALLHTLAFSLTGAQHNVIQEIQNDLVKPVPMLRLVQGDVGSGKTVVAAFAILQALANGYQAALMAPTELLAEQHYKVFTKWFTPLGQQVALLSGSIKGNARTQLMENMRAGKVGLVIGTHALFQEQVEFNKLALVIIDEQHRFGVEQRASLREKGVINDCHPHQLIMTATPIPRTLAMSFYADLDCSTIDELPPGRTPVTTSVIASARREEVMLRIAEACKAGRQAYWVCPLIDESEALSCQAATTAFEMLQKYLAPIKVGLIHGRMAGQDKDKIMQAFQNGHIQLLVATTVIEVGVDVPNASLMIIENAERMGLSQLHQLRGRVGRGAVASHCILLYQTLSDLAKERLSVMRDTTDGFKIAQRDLELRGPGEVFGTRQTGALSFRVAQLVRDRDLLSDVQQAADWIFQHDQEKIAPIINRWMRSEHEGTI